MKEEGTYIIYIICGISSLIILLLLRTMLIKSNLGVHFNVILLDSLFDNEYGLVGLNFFYGY